MQRKQSATTAYIPARAEIEPPWTPTTTPTPPTMATPPEAWLYALLSTGLFAGGLYVLAVYGANWSRDVGVVLSLVLFVVLFVAILIILTGGLPGLLRERNHRLYIERTYQIQAQALGNEERRIGVEELRERRLFEVETVKRLQITTTAAPVAAQGGAWVDARPNPALTMAYELAASLYGPDGFPDATQVHPSGHIAVAVPWSKRGEWRGTQDGEAARRYLMEPTDGPALVVQVGNNPALNVGAYPTWATVRENYPAFRGV